jgi:hypothetical protein
VQVVALVPAAGPVPPPIIVVTPDVNASSICCGHMKMNVRVDAAGGQDHSLAGDDLGRRADGNAHLRLGIGISRLPDPPDGAVLQAHIGFANAPMVDNEGVRDDRIGD